MNSSPDPSQLFRIDPLTGDPNLLAFLDFLIHARQQADHPPLSLIVLDINRFSAVGDRHHGDSILRWISLALEEETGAPVYRIGGDEFVIVLQDSGHAGQATLARRVYEQLNLAAERFGLRAPLATVAVLQYAQGEACDPAEVLGQLNAAMLEVKTQLNGSFKCFQAAEMPRVRHWIIDNMIGRLTTLGEMLDETLRLANSDPLTGMPNLRAAQGQLQSRAAHAAALGQAISVLLVDGDDLGRYNEISYAAGDKMIQRLAGVLKEQLRPADFIARWRMGDEFLIVLPQTPPEQAAGVAKRLCQAVSAASQGWPIPVTISVGVSGLPAGRGGQAVIDRDPLDAQLLSRVQAALERAKAAGKNRVSVAEG